MIGNVRDTGPTNANYCSGVAIREYLDQGIPSLLKKLRSVLCWQMN